MIGQEILNWDDDLLRFGGDVSVYLGQADVYGTFLYGRNANSFANPANPGGTNEALSFSGGFRPTRLRHPRQARGDSSRGARSRPSSRHGRSRQIFLRVLPRTEDLAPSPRAPGLRARFWKSGSTYERRYIPGISYLRRHPAFGPIHVVPVRHPGANLLRSRL